MTLRHRVIDSRLFEGITLFRNVRNRLPSDSASQADERNPQ